MSPSTSPFLLESIRKGAQLKDLQAVGVTLDNFDIPEHINLATELWDTIQKFGQESHPDDNLFRANSGDPKINPAALRIRIAYGLGGLLEAWVDIKWALLRKMRIKNQKLEQVLFYSPELVCAPPC